MHQQARWAMMEFLIDHFNLGELRTLAFDLNINFEDLSGRAKRDKVVSLIEYAERRGRLDDLVGYVKRLRPYAEWPPEFSQTQSSINVNIGNVGPKAGISKGSSVRAYNIASRGPDTSEEFSNQKEEFKRELKELQRRIEAIDSEEEFPSRQRLIVVENLQDVSEEASTFAPNVRWMALRLDDTREVLREMSSMPNIGEDIVGRINEFSQVVDELIALSGKISDRSG